MNTKDETPRLIRTMKETWNDEIILETHVAGTTFIEDSEEILNTLKNIPAYMITLSLDREPDNEFDEYAVRVLASVRGFSKSRYIGYIPREISKSIAYALDNSDDYDVLLSPPRFIGGESPRDNIGIFFSLKVQRKCRSFY